MANSAQRYRLWLAPPVPLRAASVDSGRRRRFTPPGIIYATGATQRRRRCFAPRACPCAAGVASRCGRYQESPVLSLSDQVYFRSTHSFATCLGHLFFPLRRERCAECAAQSALRRVRCAENAARRALLSPAQDPDSNAQMWLSQSTVNLLGFLELSKFLELLEFSELFGSFEIFVNFEIFYDFWNL